MNRELNKIFNVKTRKARRRILDKFDISKEDKNEVLNKINNSNNISNNTSSMLFADLEYIYFCEIDILNNKIVFFKSIEDNITQYSNFEEFNNAQVNNGSCAAWPVEIDWNNKFIVLDFFNYNTSNSGHSFISTINSTIYMEGFSKYDRVIHKLSKPFGLLYEDNHYGGEFSSNDTIYKKISDNLFKIYEIYDINNDKLFTIYRYENERDIPQ